MPNVGGLELVFMALIAMIWVVVPVTIVLLVRANRARNISPTSDPALDARECGWRTARSTTASTSGSAPSCKAIERDPREGDRRPHRRVLPRGRLRPDEQLRRHRPTSCGRAATASCSSSRSRSPGTLEAKGFEERLMRLGPPPAEPEVPGQFWIDFIRDTAPVFRKPTIEQLGEFIAPTFQALIDGAKYVAAAAARRSSTRSDPDVIVEDNVVSFPAIDVDRTAVGPPRVVQPGGDQGRGGRAVLVGLPGGGPVATGRPSSRRSGRTHGDMWADFDAFCREHGEPAGCRTARSARTSCTSRRGSTSTPTRPRRTTSAPRRSARPGTSWTRRSAPPTTTWELPDAPARRATGR